MSTAVLVKSQASYQGTLSVLQPLKKELQTRLKGLNQVVIKINFVNTFKGLAVTPSESVRAFIDFIKPFYKNKIIISEQASIGSTQKGFQRWGFTALTDRQVEVFDVANDQAEKVTINYPHGQLVLPIAKIYLNAPFLVSMTRPKTHDSTVVTLGLKNILVGAIKGNLRVRGVIHKGMDIHWIMFNIAKLVYPDLVILDGTIGMEGNGPGNGSPIKAGWQVASFDPLLADSLATYLMDFDIHTVGYLTLLHEAKMGQIYPDDKVEIIGENPKKMLTPFLPHQTIEHQLLWR